MSAATQADDRLEPQAVTAVARQAEPPMIRISDPILSVRIEHPAGSNIPPVACHNSGGFHPPAGRLDDKTVIQMNEDHWRASD